MLGGVGWLGSRVFSRLSRVRHPGFVDVGFADLYTDPYPVYRWLRRDNPVAYAPKAGGYCLVTRWDDVEAVLSDDATFGPLGAESVMPATLATSLLGLDGAEHDRVRKVMQPSFQPRRAKALAESQVRMVADDLIDGFVGDGQAELIEGFCAPVAVELIARMLGFDDLPAELLNRWYDHLACLFMVEAPLPARQKAEQTNDEIDQLLLPRLRRLARRPDSSLPATMLCGHSDLAGLSEREALANTKVILFAGMQELRDLLGHTLFALLTHPDQLAHVQADPSLLKAAVDEAARWGSPVGMIPRRSKRATKLSGFSIPAGTSLAVAIGSANHDDNRWTQPERFDLHRREGMHLAFATGIHFCLGAWLARTATQSAIQRILQRIPDLQLALGQTPHVAGWTFRAVRHLHTTWTTRTPS